MNMLFTCNHTVENIGIALEISLNKSWLAK